MNLSGETPNISASFRAVLTLMALAPRSMFEMCCLGMPPRRSRIRLRRSSVVQIRWAPFCLRSRPVYAYLGIAVTVCRFVLGTDWSLIADP